MKIERELVIVVFARRPLWRRLLALPVRQCDVVRGAFTLSAYHHNASSFAGAGATAEEAARGIQRFPALGRSVAEYGFRLDEIAEVFGVDVQDFTTPLERERWQHPSTDGKLGASNAGGESK